jgi:hypothetical protein
VYTRRRCGKGLGMNVADIVKEASELGITLRTDGDFVTYSPRSRTPQAFVDRLRQHKQAVLLYLRQQQSTSAEPWMLAEWRRLSIPDWRRILQQSIYKGDRKREEYARWMLREVLEDREYEVGAS